MLLVGENLRSPSRTSHTKLLAMRNHFSEAFASSFVFINGILVSSKKKKDKKIKKNTLIWKDK